MAERPARKHAQAPRARRCVRTERLTPHMVRVVLGGEGLAEFAGGRAAPTTTSSCCSRAEGVTYPEPFDIDADPRGVPARAVAGDPDVHRARAGTRRTRELTIDFVVHGDEGLAGPVGGRGRSRARRCGSWAPAAPTPRTPTADWHLLVGDESALPAIAASLEALPGGRPCARLRRGRRAPRRSRRSTCPTVSRSSGCTAATGPVGEALVEAVAALEFPAGRVHAFVHGEAGFVKELRRLLPRRARDPPRGPVDLRLLAPGPRRGRLAGLQAGVERAGRGRAGARRDGGFLTRRRLAGRFPARFAWGRAGLSARGRRGRAQSRGRSTGPGVWLPPLAASGAPARPHRPPAPSHPSPLGALAPPRRLPVPAGRRLHMRESAHRERTASPSTVPHHHASTRSSTRHPPRPRQIGRRRPAPGVRVVVQHLARNRRARRRASAASATASVSKAGFVRPDPPAAAADQLRDRPPRLFQSPPARSAYRGTMGSCAAPRTLCTDSAGVSTAASTSATAATLSPPTSSSPRISRSLRSCAVVVARLVRARQPARRAAALHGRST